MATFAQIMRSQPGVFQSNTLARLGAATQTVSMALQVYQSAANLGGSFAGATAQQQAGQAETTVGKVGKLVSTLGQVQAAVNASAAQLQALKARLAAIVQLAQAEGFIVTPTGQVLLAPWMYNQFVVAAYKARAAFYQGQIRTVVMLATAADIQKGLAFAKIAIDLVNAIASPNRPPSAPGAVPDLDAGGNTGSGSLTNPAQASQLEPAGGLAGGGMLGAAIGPGLGAAIGPGAIGSGLGAGAVAGMGAAGAASMSPGLAGAGVAGATMIAGGAGGRGMGGGLMGVGAPLGGLAGRDEEKREARAWELTEDEDVWAPGDVPGTDDGVLA